MRLSIVLVLAIIQGFAELLPISSSAHVIIAERIFGLDPTTPELTFLLVMLHCGTMFAVLVYFWRRWKELLSRTNPNRGRFIGMIVITSAATGILGLGLQLLIEKIVLGGTKGAAVEDLFGNSWIIGGALAAVGALIIVAGRCAARTKSGLGESRRPLISAFIVGLVQGLSLPFRGFSRSGASISAGMLAGMGREFAEEFSFFLAVILTVPVVGREVWRLEASGRTTGDVASLPWIMGGLGLVFSFAAGSLAIRWLSAWLDKGRWIWFGVYCLVASALVLCLRGLGILAQ
jgi:undecaprenyl-diphosphatase